MPNPNISGALTLAQKTAIKGNIDNNKLVIDAFGVNLTPEGRRTLAKTGPDSLSFVEKALQIAKLHATSVPGDMTMLEFEKDVVLFQDLTELKLHHDPYFELINDTLMAVGSEAYRQALRIYATVKELAK